MANSNITISKLLETNVPSTLDDGNIVFSEQGNMYVYDKSKNKVKISDVIVVSTLPNSGQANKIYILNTNFSLNYYDTSWHLLGGSDQISRGTTAPTDTSKLFLDITDTSKPILKYYNGTSWVDINHFHLNKTQLDKIGEDSITGEMKYNNKAVVNADISNRSNGRAIVFNSSTGNNEYADINVSGIIGSSQITNVGNMIDIASGEEKTFVHTATTDENIIINVQEQIAGSSVTDTHVDFSDSSKYTSQDSEKILIGSNKVQLKSGATCVNNYKFEETSGIVCTDSKGLYNGTYNGTTSITGNVGNARSFNGTSDYIQFSNKVIPQGKKSVRFKMNSNKTSYQVILANCNSNGGGTDVGVQFSINGTNKLQVISRNGSGSVYNLYSNVIVADGNWHDILFTWDGTTNTNAVKLYVDNMTVPDSMTTATATEGVPIYNLKIGRREDSVNSYYYQGLLDELEIYNDVINVSNLNTNPTYLITTGNSDYSLTTISSITSLTIPITTPTNTSIKCLFSVDNKTNWLYKDGTGIHKYTGDLTQIWTSSNTNNELQTYFTNLNITQLTNDLSGLGIIPVSLDLAFQLTTTDITITPTISTITMVYTESPHTELASFGSYGEQYVKFGVKRINSSTLGVKNLTPKSRKINVNVCIKTS